MTSLCNRQLFLNSVLQTSKSAFRSSSRKVSFLCNALITQAQTATACNKRMLQVFCFAYCTSVSLGTEPVLEMVPMLVIIGEMILICAAPTAVGVDQPQSASTSMTQSVYQPASLSRVFIGVQPGRGVARLTKVGKPSGPMSLVSEDARL